MRAILPLNPTLYRRLNEQFGDVQISKQGVEYTFYPGGVFHQHREMVATYGEQYSIACPYCHHKRPGDPDLGHHLSIGYLWGVPNADNESRWWMAHCWRNDCMREERFRRSLQTQVWHGYDFGKRKAIEILRGKPATPLPEVVDWPGECLELKHLPADHSGIAYLRSRNMDPWRIGEQYGVRYCMSPHADYPVCSNRLIIPINQDGKMVTWQARYTGNIDWKRTGIPKYYNQPGGRKSSCLYGLDSARNLPIVTVVESAPTVWWLGPGTVATLGKSMSDTQLTLLRTNWQTVILALDADAYLQSAEVCARLKGFVKVVMLILEPGQDPGEMPQDQFWDLVVQAAAKQGVSLPN